MSDQHKAVAVNTVKEIGKVLCILVIVIPFLVFLGYLTEIEILRRGTSSSPPMDPVTAYLFVISGVALWLVRERRYSSQKRNTSQFLGVIVAIVGAAKLLSIFLGFDLLLSDLFASNLYDPITNRIIQMAPNTAFNFILAGLAIVLIDSTRGKKERSISQIFCIAISLMSLLNLYGYVYGVDFLIGVAAYLPMSLPGAINFLVLSISVLFLRPHKGSMALIIGENPLEVFLLRILAFILPLIFGWGVVYLVNHGVISNEMGTAIFAVLSYSIALFLLGRKSLIQQRLRMVRKKAMMQINKDARRLHSIMDNSGAVIFIRDLTGKFLTVNRQYEMLYDVKKEDIIGKNIKEVFPEEMSSIGLAEDQEVIKTGRSVTSEEKINTGDYTYTFLNNKFPLTDHNGQIYAVCGISTDISRMKEYEAELSEKEKRLQTILENIGEGIVVSDPNGKFLVYNNKAEEILGAGAENVNPENWSKHYNVYYPDGKNIFPSEKLPLVRALKGESSHEVEMLIRKNGFSEGIKISVTGTPIYNEEGKPSAVVVFRDVTAKRKLQEALIEKEKKLRTILSTVEEGIIVCDKNGKSILINETAREILGKEAVESNPENWTEYNDVYYPDGETPYPREELPLTRALKGYSTESTEVVIIPKGEKIGRRIFISGKPVTDDNGNITAGVFDFRDITNCGISTFMTQRGPERRDAGNEKNKKQQRRK